jgi:hypothetical protein
MAYTMICGHFSENIILKQGDWKRQTMDAPLCKVGGGETTVNFHFMTVIVYHAFLKAYRYLPVLIIYHLCNGGFSGGTTATTNKVHLDTGCVGK